jgi:hypothetical protein
VIKAGWQLACLELLVYGVLDLTISTVPAGACSLPTYNIQIKKIEKFTQMKVALTLSLSLLTETRLLLVAGQSDQGLPEFLIFFL